MRAAKDKSEQKTLENVRNHGLEVVYVGEDDVGPGFAYSIGLFENYAHPEVIVIGLKHEISHTLLNNMAYDIKHGKTFTNGEFHDGVLDNFLCYFGNVPKEKYKEYVGGAIWFYEGKNFPLVQCVYPTVAGKFPWEKDFPEEARWYCELLTDPPKEH